LENTLERAIILSNGNRINPSDLPAHISAAKVEPFVREQTPNHPTLEELEKAYIFWVLTQNEWNKSKVAQILGIDTSTLYRKIEKYELKEK
jgi:DNA-binding NtrC family response regulator